MKILQVISYFAPKFGGDVNVCYNISKELARRGHDITILTTDYGFDSAFARDVEAHGVSVVPLPTRFNIGLFLYTPSIDAWLEDNIELFDIIHMHNYRSFQNNRILRSAQKNDIPYIIQPHGSLIPFSQKVFLKKLYDSIWSRTLLNNSARVIVLNATEAQQCQSIGIPEESIEMIPNGIDVTEFDTLPESGEFRKRYDIPSNTRVVLYTGRLHRSKGLGLLIDAFHLLINRGLNIHLVIVGPDDGYLKAILEKITDLGIQDSVRLIGFISQREKNQAFVDADVFVTPAFSGFPVTFLEACASGTPIVTTNYGDRLTWLNETAGIVTEYDPTCIADALELLVTDSELSKRLGDNGRMIVANHFSWATITPLVESIYLRSIEGVKDEQPTKGTDIPSFN